MLVVSPLGRLVHRSLCRNPFKSKGASHTLLPQTTLTAEASPDFLKAREHPYPSTRKHLFLSVSHATSSWSSLWGQVGTCPVLDIWKKCAAALGSAWAVRRLGCKHHLSCCNRALPLLQNHPSLKSDIL